MTGLILYIVFMRRRDRLSSFKTIMETIELNESNYCNQKSVSMEFSFEEHDLLNSILCHAMDGMDLAVPYVYELSEDSEIRHRYELLEKIRIRSSTLWKERFDNAPYNNN